MSEPPVGPIAGRAVHAEGGLVADRPRGLWLARLAAAAGLVAALAGLSAWWALARWFRSSQEAAERAAAAGRYAEARDRLARLSRWWPGRPEVEYLLGVCEEATGRPAEARAAWARVPADSPLADPAALKRAGLALDLGRLDEAEAVLTGALLRPTRHRLATALRRDLLKVLWRQGRLDEVRALIERNWRDTSREFGPDSATALEDLRSHLALDLEVYHVGGVRELLDEASKSAPDDARVWLGRANLAVRTGRLDEARGWLARCLEREHAGDPALWRAALDLAVASNDLELAGLAAGSLTTADLAPERLERLRAWLAARRGDIASERAALEARLAREPADAEALERLAELSLQAGQVDRAGALRHRKAEVDRVRRLYGHRVSADFKADAVGLADQAEALGRWFEARAFLALQRKLRPDDGTVRDRLARLDREHPDQDHGPLTSPERLSAALGLTVPKAGAVSNWLGKRIDAPRPSAGGAPRFTDDAGAAGLRFTFDNGASPLRQLPETMSGGVALLDYDGDGWLDVYCVQGGKFPPDPKQLPAGDRLFRNKADGTFEDVTGRSGLAAMPGGYGHGVAVGDVDNDGRPDLLVTRWRSYGLYRNRGDGAFEDVTERWGLGGDRDWPTSAAFADLDGDGDLDLYVCHYIAWDASNPKVCRETPGGPVSYCAPHLLPHAADHVFRNDGGRFTDVTSEAGFNDPDGRGLGVLAADLDDDGLVDLFVANDGTANYLFRNLGGFRFEETGLSAGVAASAEGGYQAGMGVACGDLDGDGRLDLVVTNFYGESTSLFRSVGPGLFADRTAQAGLREATRYVLGFGTALADLDNDGSLDLATANGHVNDIRPVAPYAMPAQLFLGGPNGRLTDASARAGPAWAVGRVGRGLAAGDLDNDGLVDLVVVDQAGPVALFHNRGVGDDGRARGHSVTFRLEGSPSNRDAVGARVTVRSGGRRQVSARVGGGSYQSACDPRLHFGLGASGRFEEVEVRWPSGRVDRFRDLPAGTGYRLREGDDQARPLEGFGGAGR
jgi:thioredoxin-like negative regulator of GroEL